jgi:hypothetical protein
VLAEKAYQFSVNINWLPQYDEDAFRIMMQAQKNVNGRQLVRNGLPGLLPRRLWEWMIEKVKIPQDLRWADLSNQQLHAMLNIVFCNKHIVKGKTTFKEEFVTAGGIALEEVDFKTMASRKIKGLYFAGEVLDIDGVTGGFNFQAAWTTSWIAACSVSKPDT